jgi:hypothetical protein
MAATLTIRDETTSGETTNEFVLDFLTERITVRELIRSRVYQEVQDYNRGHRREFQGLVQPTGAEATLNGYRLDAPRQIDWRQQFERALEAFETNRVLILVGERQAETLDAEIVVKPGVEVSFLKLTPLVGG